MNQNNKEEEMREKIKDEMITIVAVILVALVVGLGARIYLGWYFSLPVVKFTPDNRIVAVEVKGQHYGPEYMEKVGDRYKKNWVSFDWKPE